ncbi:MAG: hypothetical protein LBQ03_01905 [Puniceicoccales bacterium]|nr:hypothetical protein [Puniceicoccales bacterium]
MVNKLLIRCGLSISMLTFCWLIFTKKYFNFYTGLWLFGIGFVSYFCFYHFTFIQLLSTATAMFYAAHVTDIDQFSVFSAFFVQNFLFIFFDSDFNSSTLIQSSLLSLIGIGITKIDIIPPNVRRRETAY